MEINPGEKASMTLEQGKQKTFSHNKPVLYQVVTTGGSIVEVQLPAGVELKIISAGDIDTININIYESQTGPKEII